MDTNEQSKSISRRNFLAGLGATAGAIGLSTLMTGCNDEKKAAAISLSHGNSSDLFPVYENGEYQKKDFSHLTKNPDLGLTPENISHHLGLYEKYVDKVNKSEKQMAQNDIDEFSMKNLAFSLNGMALHDIYFSNMTTEKTKMSAALTKAIEGTFGSYSTYYQNLTDLAMKVKGWSITGLNLLNGKIYNYAEDTHSSNFPIYVMPIMVLDIYDHAWVKQFGETEAAKRAYIEVFSKIIDWDLVSQRYDAMQIMYK